MAKNKKGKSSNHKRRAEGPSKNSNPFEVRANNSRKKFDVLNRRVKGAERNIANARAKAIERRKKTLLVDYNQQKRTNSFNDRRFGEHDASMSVEEKLLVRFQKERAKRAKKGALYRLGDDDGDMEDVDEGLLLTHKGKAIGEDYQPDPLDRMPGSDDEGGGVDADATAALHFGGPGDGGGPRRDAERRRAEGAAAAAAGGEKSRKDVIDEIIAKSKAGKAERAQTREYNEALVEGLDGAFEELQGLLQEAGAVRPTGREKPRRELDEFDTLTRELNFEARGRAADRTKSEEEVAQEERARLEALERRRLARMRGELEEGGGDEEEEEEEDGLKGRRRRRKAAAAATDDDLEDEFEVDDRFGVKYSALAAAGRGAYAVGADQEEEGEGEGAGGGGGEKEEEEEDESEAGGEEEEEDEGSSGDELVEDGVDMEEEEDEDGDEKPAKKKKAGSGKGGKALKFRLPGTATEMPYVFDCPMSMEELLDLFEKHATSVEDVCTIIDRIIKCHNVKLAAGNREKMHNFYGLLLRRVAALGHARAVGGRAARGADKELDFLAGAVVGLTRQLPAGAAPLWGRWLREQQRALGKRLRDHALGGAASCWPGAGELLLLRLLFRCWPATDRRHPVATPALLLLGQCLAQCPVVGAGDAAAGTFCAALLAEGCAEARRLAPEALAWAAGALRRFVPGGAGGHRREKAAAAAALPTLAAARLPDLRAAAAAFAGGAPPRLKLAWCALGNAAEAGEEEGGGGGGEGGEEGAGAGGEGVPPGFAAGLLAANLRLVTALTAPHAEGAGADALPELAAPALAALGALRPDIGPELGAPLAALALATGEALAAAATRARERRRPLCWQARANARAAQGKHRLLAPKFEENYTVRRDKGEDREKAKLKQLKRQVKREKKGAARELRKDADFLAQERWREKTEKDATRKRRLRENAAWLEEQSAAFNLQVKLGGGLLKGGGSGAKRLKR